MSVLISCRYLGRKRTELTHDPTNSSIFTDAPLDNQGEGTTFSPTDLLAGSLVSCIITTMAIVAERSGIDMGGAFGTIEKHMVLNPRRIGTLPVKLHLPRALSDDQRKKLERAAHTCPVHESLNPAVVIEVGFEYDL